MKLVLIFVLGTFAYTLLYSVYGAAAKAMPGRIAFTAAVVVGTLLGSTLAQRLFH